MFPFRKPNFSIPIYVKTWLNTKLHLIGNIIGNR